MPDCAQRKICRDRHQLIHAGSGGGSCGAGDARAAWPSAVRGLSDRAVAWLFIAPTIILLLAINIFPLFWAI